MDLSLQFQRFLRLFYVLPLSIFEIIDHLLPYAWTPKSTSHSSSSDHEPLFIPVLRWLCHLSRHCLPQRSTKYVDIAAQSLAPLVSTRSRKISSYSFVHGFLDFLLVVYHSLGNFPSLPIIWSESLGSVDGYASSSNLTTGSFLGVTSSSSGD